MTVGLTGPTGSGKSTAALIARKLGWEIIDCDLLTREVYKKEAVLGALKAAFGEEIFDGAELDRKKLAAAAFADREHTNLLNKAVLPFITGEIEIALKALAGRKVLLDAPTLFESGADRFCDYTVAVLCERELRNARITERDKLTESEAGLRLNAGQPDGFYIQRADYVIYNGGDIKTFERDVKAVLGAF